jgi:hypothetical protein
MASRQAFTLPALRSLGDLAGAEPVIGKQINNNSLTWSPAELNEARQRLDETKLEQARRRLDETKAVELKRKHEEILAVTS